MGKLHLQYSCEVSSSDVGLTTTAQRTASMLQTLGTTKGADAKGVHNITSSDKMSYGMLNMSMSDIECPHSSYTVATRGTTIAITHHFLPVSPHQNGYVRLNSN